MQATASAKRFSFGRFGGPVAVLGIAAAFAAGIVTGVVGQSVLSDTGESSGSSAAVVRPKAYYSAGQGEGLLAPEAGSARPLWAFYEEGMGEGWLAETTAIEPVVKTIAPQGRREGVQTIADRPATTLPAITYDTSWMGEGIVGGHTDRGALAAPVVAYGAPGMGEGWLAQGRPQSPIVAHPSDGQGEGWVGNGRP